MRVFEDSIVISLHPVSVSFAMRLRSRPGQLHHRPARPRRDESIRIGLRGVLTISMSGYAGMQLTARASPNGVNEVLRKALQGRWVCCCSAWPALCFADASESACAHRIGFGGQWPARGAASLQGYVGPA